MIEDWCMIATQQSAKGIIFTCDTLEVPESHFLKLVHVSLFPWIVQNNWMWPILGGIASEVVSWLQSKWSWNVVRRNKFSSSTLMSDYLGQEVAMTYHRSLGLGQEWPIEIEFLKSLNIQGMSACSILLLFFALLTPFLLLTHSFCFMTSFNCNVRIIATVETDTKQRWNTFFKWHLKASTQLRIELNFYERKLLVLNANYVKTI